MLDNSCKICAKQISKFSGLIQFSLVFYFPNIFCRRLRLSFRSSVSNLHRRSDFPFNCGRRFSAVVVFVHSIQCCMGIAHFHFEFFCPDRFRLQQVWTKKLDWRQICSVHKKMLEGTNSLWIKWDICSILWKLGDFPEITSGRDSLGIVDHEWTPPQDINYKSIFATYVLSSEEYSDLKDFSFCVKRETFH